MVHKKEKKKEYYVAVYEKTPFFSLIEHPKHIAKFMQMTPTEAKNLKKKLKKKGFGSVVVQPSGSQKELELKRMAGWK